MPVQYPSLSQGDQEQRYKEIAGNTLFPYSYPFYLDNTSGNFPTAFAPTNGPAMHYCTFAFQADNNLAISDLEVQASFVFGRTSTVKTTQVLVEVSYLNILDPNIIIPFGTAPAIPTRPGDTGNIIYRNFLQAIIPDDSGAGFPSVLTIDDFRRYEPYNYLLKFNQIIYMFVAVVDGSVTQLQSISGSFIFHTLTTGLKI